MQTSEQINELAGALAKAQGQMGGAVKDSANPFFKSKYADLSSVWDACRKPLADNGLSVIQFPTSEHSLVSVETMLLHQSGQWVKDTLTVTAKDDSPQAIGSATTYARRYGLQSVVGVAPEDDDAEAAQPRNTASRFDQKPTYSAPDVVLRDSSHADDAGADLMITRVDATATKNKNVTKYLVSLSDGRQVSTINRALGTRCTEYCDAGAAVEVKCHKSPYGLELDEVGSPSDPKSESTVTLDASQIPF